MSIRKWFWLMDPAGRSPYIQAWMLSLPVLFDDHISFVCFDDIGSKSSEPKPNHVEHKKCCPKNITNFEPIVQWPLDVDPEIRANLDFCIIFDEKREDDTTTWRPPLRMPRVTASELAQIAIPFHSPEDLKLDTTTENAFMRHGREMEALCRLNFSRRRVELPGSVPDPSAFETVKFRSDPSIFEPAKLTDPSTFETAKIPAKLPDPSTFQPANVPYRRKRLTPERAAAAFFMMNPDVTVAYVGDDTVSAIPTDGADPMTQLTPGMKEATDLLKIKLANYYFDNFC